MGKWEKKKELKNSGWGGGGGRDGKGRRSARSAFFFPDFRSLIPAHRKFFSLYPLFMPFSSFLIFDCPKSLYGGERIPLLMLSLIVEAQCLTSNIKGLWN